MNTISLIDGLSLIVCACIVILCVGMLKEQTTWRCAPAHIGIGVIGVVAFLTCISLMHNAHQAHWPGLALNVGLAGCLGYLALTPEQRSRWDGRERRASGDRSGEIR